MTRTTIRTSTRVMVIVHSHHSSKPVDLSLDTISFKTSKSIKGVGSMSLDVVPNKNYFNVVFPNDVINMYVDPGDGRGFIRTFFGYIDKVERSEVTNPKDGSTNSMFRIVCSDFQKAFEKTSIQANASLQDRKNLVEEEYLISGGPTGLMTAGVRVHGSPPEILENLMSMLLGFGAQWVLPDSYPKDSKVIKDNRTRRLNRSAARVPKPAFLALAALGILPMISAEDGKGPELRMFDTFEKLEKKINAANLAGGDPTKIENLEQDSPNGRVLDRGTLPHDIFAEIRGGLEQLRDYHITLLDVNQNVTTLLDLLDLSFIESATIDGYVQNQAVWNEGGSLISIMKKFSNEMMNEMIFDLRPAAVPRKLQFSTNSKYLDRCFGEEYSLSPDELSLNSASGTWPDIRAGSSLSTAHAVQYVPTITFREYPYSVVEGADLGSISNLAGDDAQAIGFVPFGPVFSMKDGVKKNYRALYDYDLVPEIAAGTLSVSAIGCQFAGPKMKHLDVMTIKSADVISSTVGRSDNDTTNFFSMYAESSIGKTYKNIMKEFMPITNPISIARNGLRAREYSSRFANYSRDQLCNEENDTNPVTEQTIRNMVRWLLLLDHWEQHNIEYLTGDVQLRALPELRVGYRLDWEDRKESYYVESVSHSWAYGKEMVTSIQVSRGQRNDPFLSYIPPATARLSVGANSVEGGDRGLRGRLSTFFDVLNTPATYRSTNVTRSADKLAPEALLGNAKDADVGHFSPRDTGVPNEGLNKYDGHVIYSFGHRDTAETIENLIVKKAVTPSTKASEEVVKNQVETPGPLPKEEVVKTKRPFKRASSRYDEIFKEFGDAAKNPIPLAFMKALCHNESGFNKSNSTGPAWGLMQVGIDGFPDGSYPDLNPKNDYLGPPNAPSFLSKKGERKLKKSGKVLASWNSRKGTTYLPANALEPRLNVEICVDVLTRVIDALEDGGLSFSWSSPDAVGFLIAGWNAGYSRKGGASLMIKWMVKNGHDLTIENMVKLVGAQRADETETYKVTEHLKSKKKFTWWKRVRDEYFFIKESE